MPQKLKWTNPSPILGANLYFCRDIFLLSGQFTPDIFPGSLSRTILNAILVTTQVSLLTTYFFSIFQDRYLWGYIVSFFSVGSGDRRVALVFLNLTEFHLVKFGFDSPCNCLGFHFIILKHDFSTYFVNFLLNFSIHFPMNFNSYHPVSSLFLLSFFVFVWIICWAASVDHG